MALSKFDKAMKDSNGNPSFKGFLFESFMTLVNGLQFKYPCLPEVFSLSAHVYLGTSVKSV